MEEKERYEYYLGTNSIKDNKTNQIYGYIVDLLNQQDKRIKELEEELDDAKRDYIPKLEFGLQRANKMGRDAEKENQQLKQQLHDLPKKIVEEIRKEIEFPLYVHPDFDEFECVFDIDKLLDTILKKYGGKDE